MKVRAHLRVAKGDSGKPQVNATRRPMHAPLTNSAGSPLPTVAFAVDLDIPDALFKQAEQVIATISIPESAATIAAEVTQ